MPRREVLPQTFMASTGVSKVVTLAATGNQTLDAGATHEWLILPTADLTLSIGSSLAGQEITVLVKQTLTASKTITFGSGFKPTGTLATGVTADRMFVLTFISDGTNFYEVKRTAAITTT